MDITCIKGWIVRNTKHICYGAGAMVCAAICVFSLLYGKVQITPNNYKNSHWVSQNSILYIDVPEHGHAEGELKLSEGARRIYLAWVGGSQCCSVLDADKDDGNCTMDEVLLLEGSGYWNLKGQYVIDISVDKVGLNTDQIILERTQ